jgi:hypothetical protein
VRRFAGLFIGGGFGVLFVLLNTGAPLDPTIAAGLRVLAVAAFAGLVVLAARAGSAATADAADAPNAPDAPEQVRMDRFGSGYWIVVAAEVVALFGGLQVLRLLDAPPEAGAAWVAVVVGLHFIAFRWVWQQRSILVPGILLTGYGGAGLIMAATPAVDWVPLVSGVLSGITLLAGCLLVAGRESARAASRP